MQRFGQEDAWLNYYEFKEGAPNMAEEKNYIDILNKARRRRTVSYTHLTLPTN